MTRSALNRQRQVPPYLKTIPFKPYQETSSTHQPSWRWNELKPIILERFEIEELAAVQEHMKRKHNFDAEIHQYKYRIYGRWHAKKYQALPTPKSASGSGEAQATSRSLRSPAPEVSSIRATSSFEKVRLTTTGEPQANHATKTEGSKASALHEALLKPSRSQSSRQANMTRSKRPASNSSHNSVTPGKRIKFDDTDTDAPRVSSVDSSTPPFSTADVLSLAAPDVELGWTFYDPMNDDVEHSLNVNLRYENPSVQSGDEQSASPIPAAVDSHPEDGGGIFFVQVSSAEFFFTQVQIQKVETAADFFLTCWRLREAFQLYNVVWKWSRESSRHADNRIRQLQCRALVGCYRSVAHDSDRDIVRQMFVDYFDSSSQISASVDGFEKDYLGKLYVDLRCQQVLEAGSQSQDEVGVSDISYHPCAFADSIPFDQALDIALIEIFPRPSSTHGVQAEAIYHQDFQRVNLFDSAAKHYGCGIRYMAAWCQQQFQGRRRVRLSCLEISGFRPEKHSHKYDLFCFLWTNWIQSTRSSDEEVTMSSQDTILGQHFRDMEQRFRDVWAVEAGRTTGLSAADMLYAISCVITGYMPTIRAPTNVDGIFMQDATRAVQKLSDLTNSELVDAVLRAHANRQRLRRLSKDDEIAKHALQEGVFAAVRDTLGLVVISDVISDLPNHEPLGKTPSHPVLAEQLQLEYLPFKPARSSTDPTLASVKSSEQSSLRRMALRLKAEGWNQPRTSPSLPSQAMNLRNSSAPSVETLTDSFGAVSILNP